jgi:uncharacterized protein YjiK
MKSSVTLLLFLLIYGISNAQTKTKLTSIASRLVDVVEPSDICLATDRKHFYIVNDNGQLVKTNLLFEPVQVAEKELYDPEAVYCDSNYIYVVEERTRTLTLFDHNGLKAYRSINYPYGGGRNKGYEAFTFNQITQRYILVTERDPIWIFELDKDLRVFNQFEFKYKGDISSAAWYANKLWLLSDENRELLRLNPRSFEIEHIYQIPVINPEGFVFMPDGKLIVISDDMQRAWTFDINVFTN